MRYVGKKSDVPADARNLTQANTSLQSDVNDGDSDNSITDSIPPLPSPIKPRKLPTKSDENLDQKRVSLFPQEVN